MLWFYIVVFLISCLILFLSGKWLIEGLSRIARYLQWREFVVAFFVIAFAAAIPNLFVGINSAIHKIPQLSFGDIVGGNLIDLTLAVAIAVFFAKGLPAGSKMVQSSALFTMIIAVLPLILILDGKLGRGDALILILTFFVYSFWLFSKKERFSKLYDGEKESVVKEFKLFIKDLGKVLLGIILLLIAAEGIVESASFFAQNLNLSLVLVGVLIVALGNALPEIYFTLIAARKAENWMILGDLMGSVIVAATLVLGIVALICPIEISDFSPFAIARFFLIIAAIFFLFFVRTDRKITKKEGLFLLVIYVLFVLFEILL